MPHSRAEFDPATIMNGIDDHGSSPSTASAISVGQTVSGNVEMGGDEDWFAVSLSAGQTIDVTMTGLSLPDTVVGIYNSNGNLLDFNDDAGPSSLNSFLTFTAPSAGTYYVAGTGFAQNTGTYQINVSASSGPSSPPPTSPTSAGALVDTIVWGQAVTGGTSISVFFAPNGYETTAPDGLPITSDGFNNFEIQQFEEAFSAIEAVINVTFNVVNSASQADLTMILDTNELGPGGFLGIFGPPGTSPGEGVGVFNAATWDRNPGGDLEVGGFGYITIVHELLHGMGLAHPHDTGGGSPVMAGVTSAFDDFGNFGLNQGIFTTMSYNSGWQTAAGGSAPTSVSPGVNNGFEAGPMALDIAALQTLYGANTTYASGNNTYILDDTNGVGTYWASIWDTNGTDEIRYNGSRDAVIDLRAATLQYEDGGGGFVSVADGIRGGFTIANGVVIENATGGSGRDEIIGNDANNNLSGGSGFDTLMGEAGNDTLNGGALADSIYGGTGNDSLLGEGGFDQLFGEGGNDTLRAGDTADRLYGGEGNDVLFGGSNFGTTVDGLWGGAGNDTLFGEGGFDLLDGGAGNDRLDGGTNADNLYGRDGQDTLLGGEGLDRLFGGNGNDLGRGGNGNDGLFGQVGNDTLYGDAGNDRFFGGTGNDAIFGGSGNDTVFAGAGFDTIDGGIGNDRLQGDFNADTFVFTNGHGDDIITDFAATNVFEKIDLSGISAITGLTDLENNHMSQSGGNVVIDTGGGNSITLLGVNINDLDNSDFIF